MLIFKYGDIFLNRMNPGEILWDTVEIITHKFIFKYV